MPHLKVIKMYCGGDNGGVVSFGDHAITITDMRYNMFFDQQDYMISGRMWTENDRNTSRVWINQSYANKFNKAVGDKIDIKLLFRIPIAFITPKNCAFCSTVI